jgi:Xaa-Pro aminopeptidase
VDYKKRISALRDAFESIGLDSFFVTSNVNVSYLSGFKGQDSMLLVCRDKSYFITDSRYIEEASRTLKGFEVALVDKAIYDTVKDIVRSSRLKKMGFESMDMPYGAAHKLKGELKPFGFSGVSGLIKGMRAIKDADEIALIKKSAALVNDIFKKIEPQIRPGVSEESLARAIEISFIGKGAKAGFDPIIARGHNASKPHALPSSDKISKDDMVMVDIGCTLEGYNSDMTRMVIRGRAKDKLKKIYTIVKDAQRKAIEKISPGARIADVDNAARAHIAEEGYGKYFGHATGHGIGLEVHEEPTISGVSEGVLRRGMVFTVEPAIYLPGVGGVRIEDMVLVTDNGCEILT